MKYDKKKLMMIFAASVAGIITSFMFSRFEFNIDGETEISKKFIPTQNSNEIRLSLDANESKKAESFKKEVLSKKQLDETIKKINSIKNGEKIVPALLALKDAQDSIQSNPNVKVLFQFLKTSPKDGIKLITETLSELPRTEEFAIQRISLIQSLGIIANDEAKQLAFEYAMDYKPAQRPSPEAAKTEEELNKALSTNFDLAVPIEAYKTYIEMETDPSRAIENTKSVIAAQSDFLIQDGMIGFFGQKFPNQNETLKTELIEAGYSSLFDEPSQAEEGKES